MMSSRTRSPCGETHGPLGDDVTDAAGAAGELPGHARRPSGLRPAHTSGKPTMSGALLDTLRFALVVLDTTGRVMLWSPTAEDLLGWSGEAVGRHIGTLLATAEPTADPADETTRGTLPPPGTGDRVLAHVRRAGRWTGILPMRHRDGRTVQAEVRASLLLDGDGEPSVLWAFAATTIVRTVEEDLAVMEALFDTAPLGVGLLDTELRFVRVNDVLARMNGLPIDAHIGRTIGEVLGEPVGRELVGIQRDVLHTGKPVVDVTVPVQHGHRSVSYSRLQDRTGKVLGIGCTVMDVTQRERATAAADRARHRLALLDEVGVRLADILDVHRIATELSAALVPAFGDYDAVLLLRAVARGGELPRSRYARFHPLVMLSVSGDLDNPPGRQLATLDTDMEFDEGSVFADVLQRGVPRLLDSPGEIARITFPGDPRVGIALELGIHSMVLAPLRAHGVVLGMLVAGRAADREPFDGDDLALLVEIADRSAAALDNARLYAREREGALMLQRSLLPQTVPEPTGVKLAFRYVPGSRGTEVGGDWFDVISLAGGRLALVIGDVMGHGLHAAVTMGRLRTAVRTLAPLDLPPGKLLRYINDVADDLAYGHDEPLMATCVYAVYDPSTRHVAVAKAGHLPPLLVPPDPADVIRQLDLPSGAPLGVGGVEFDGVEFEVPDGTVLVLYTDGLVEIRGEDVSTGIARLVDRLGPRHASLEDACDAVLADLDLSREPDDVALLMARLGGLPHDAAITWTFPAEPTAVARARALVRQTLREWVLVALEDTAVLLVSELVTNSLRYAHGPIGVRMVRGASLLVEVSDPLPDPPRERRVDHTDEGGRGLQLVAHSARRWGTRHSPAGKVVWFELALPGT
jgi:PAS domain S-box-containing protein